MKFMVMVKATADSEAGKMPSTELLTAMGKFNEELVRAGVMLAGEGLHPSSKGKRMRFSGTSRTVIDGPFAETKDLVAGFWIWQCKSVEEAVEWVKRCPNPMLVDSDIELRPMFEYEIEDFSAAAKPEIREDIARVNDEISQGQAARAKDSQPPHEKTNPKKFLILGKATPDSEAETTPSVEALLAMEKFHLELVKAGVILAAEGLRPSSKGKRVRFSGTRRTVIDGPFAESKELVAGFSIWQCASMEEAVAWAKRIPNPMAADSEIEIRPIFGIDDFGPAATPEFRENDARLRNEISGR